MKNSDKQIIKQAEERVIDLYHSSRNENLVYHSIDHARNVVEKVNEIAAHYEVSEKDVIVLNIAACFHDTGHLFTDPSSHEQKSVELMKEFLAEKGDYAALTNDI